MEALASSGAKVAVIEVMLPVIDGITLCSAIKSDPRTKSVKVVLTSSKPFQEDSDSCQKSGADLILRKPVDVPKLVRWVRDAVGSPEPPGAGDAPAAWPRKAPRCG